jgi:2-polyprenyl-3-methyl-5-hydroxy-6-metoxy-1,4-benzoquinol methylase
MQSGESAHREKGLQAFLSKPRIYDFFAGIVAKKRSQIEFVKKYVNPFPGCRILDIGCGTADILSSLPDSIGEYSGFDMNPAYIEYAKKRWRNRTNCRFFCQNVKDATIPEAGRYDVVLAVAILHHLTDGEADGLFDMADQALKANGVYMWKTSTGSQNG